MPAIRVKNGPDKGKVFEVADEPLTIGRDPTEAIPILDQGASRSHAEIFRVGEMCFIRDLGSKNGTFVNDEKISEELLQVGDKIRVGNTLFVFEESGVAGEEPAPRRIEFDPEPPVGATIEIDLRKGERRASSIEGVTDTRSLRVLYDLARLLTSEKREEDLLREVLERAVEAVGADAGYVFVVGEGGKLVPSATVEKNREEGRKISRSIIRRVLRSQKPVLTTDASSDAQWKERQSVILKKIQSVICVPLVSFEKVGGVLYLHGSRMGQIFADEDFDLVTAMGIQAGVAIATLRAAERERRVVLSAVRTLVAIAELRDPKTRGHSERVCTYAAAIANQMALGPRESQAVQLAGLLHDVGKVVKGDRTAVRMASEPDAAVEEHVRNGEMILKHMEGMEEVIPGITYHHARCDGSGHPAGARGPDIPLIGKIVGLANEFDNLCTMGDEAGKPYSVKEALVKLGRNAQGWYDPAVVEALLVSYRNGTLFTPEKFLLEAIVAKTEGVALGAVAPGPSAAGAARAAHVELPPGTEPAEAEAGEAP